MARSPAGAQQRPGSFQDLMSSGTLRRLVVTLGHDSSSCVESSGLDVHGSGTDRTVQAMTGCEPAAQATAGREEKGVSC